MRKTFAVVLMLVVAVAAIPARLYAAVKAGAKQQSGSLTGVAKGANQANLPNYSVQVRNASTGTLVATTVSSQTGTFSIRAQVDNPKGVLRPNQFVRARLIGAIRPHAQAVPQRAVQQGPKSHFLWVVDAEKKARMRPVTVGQWIGDGHFDSPC
jgi:multidrug efflux pump subunit AcrA (membrane-fusion protein)